MKNIDPIRDEMAKSQDPAISVIGGILTELARENDAAADKLADGKKSLSGAMNAMRALAEKHKHGSTACLDMVTGMREVLRYYGIDGISDAKIMELAMRAAGAEAPEQKPQKAEDDDFDLDALLED